MCSRVVKIVTIKTQEIIFLKGEEKAKAEKAKILNGKEKQPREIR